jgi:hypothetical protein
MIIDKTKLKRYHNASKARSIKLITDVAKDPRILKELEDSRFCPKFIENYYLDCDEYFTISQDRVKYHIYSQKKNNNLPLNNIISSLKRTCSLMQYYDINKLLNIHIILSPYKRYFPVQNEKIDIIHINGGFTSPSTNDIFIIRSEEFAKVILHEVLHHCKWIHNNNWKQSHLEQLYNAFNISKNTGLYPNEAVVELWATLMHCMFVSLDYHLPFDTLFKTELQHNLLQTNKILEMQSKRSDGLWEESTNAYCYIVFKTILLHNAKHFVHTFPYDPEYITQFLINNRLTVHKAGVKHKSQSLRMMKTSDL